MSSEIVLRTVIKVVTQQHDETDKKVTFINSVKEFSLFHALTFSFFVIYI